MEIPGLEQETATGGGYISFKAGHCNLFKGKRQPKIWTPKTIIASRVAPLAHTHKSWQQAGQHGAEAALLTCLGVCETLPGCCRAASLPGEPHLADSSQPPALPASATAGQREQTRCNTEINQRRHLAAQGYSGFSFQMHEHLSCLYRSY